MNQPTLSFEPQFPVFDRFALAQRDCVEWLRALPSECIDLVVTDPAYESLEKHRAVGTTTRLTKQWFKIFPNARFAELFRELYRVLKKNTHCYVFCDQETMFVAKPIAEAAGFKFWKGIVWDKQKIGTGYHYRARHEMILFLEKGHRNLRFRGVPDVIQCPAIRGGYPTEKPSPLCQVLVEQSSAPLEVVMDPFMGSGSAGEAALMAGRRFLGCDLEDNALAAARARLEEIDHDLPPLLRQGQKWPPPGWGKFTPPAEVDDEPESEAAE